MLSCGMDVEIEFSGKERRISTGKNFRSYNVEITDPENSVKISSLL